MANKAPYYRVFPDTDQSVMLKLTLVERGAYVTLRNLYVLDRDLFSESDRETKMKRIFGLCFAFSQEEQNAVTEIFNRFFASGNDEIDKQMAYNKKQFENGNLGGRPKPKINPNPNPEFNPTNNPNPNPKITSKKDLDLDIGLVLEEWGKIVESFSLRAIEKVSDERARSLKARVKESGSLDKFFEIVRTSLENSAFLRGEETHWQADFDFFLQKSKFLKAKEGGYSDSAKSGAGGKPRAGPDDFDRRLNAL